MFKILKKKILKADKEIREASSLEDKRRIIKRLSEKIKDNDIFIPFIDPKDFNLGIDFGEILGDRTVIQEQKFGTCVEMEEVYFIEKDGKVKKAKVLNDREAGDSYDLYDGEDFYRSSSHLVFKTLEEALLKANNILVEKIKK